MTDTYPTPYPNERDIQDLSRELDTVTNAQLTELFLPRAGSRMTTQDERPPLPIPQTTKSGATRCTPYPCINPNHVHSGQNCAACALGIHWDNADNGWHHDHPEEVTTVRHKPHPPTGELREADEPKLPLTEDGIVDPPPPIPEDDLGAIVQDLERRARARESGHPLPLPNRTNS